jgi:anaerobic selenocysteine-containing dehydrogenase
LQKEDDRHMKRRQFLFLTGAAGAAAAFEPLVGMISPPAEAPGEVMPGIETHRMTTCLMCPGACGLKIRRVDGYPVAIAGNPNHPLNAGGVCTEGLSALQLLYHPDRQVRPLRRQNGKRSNAFEPVSWDEALREISGAMQDLRAKKTPEKLALVAGRSGGSMEELLRHFMDSWGSPNFFLDEPSDGYLQVIEAMHGLSVRPAFDFENADLVLSFGADLLNAWGSPLQFQRSYASFHSAARTSKGVLVAADIRFSRTAAEASEWVGVLPGSYGALALGIAYVILREKLYDAKFAEEHLYGLDDLNDGSGTRLGFRSLVLRDYSPEVVSRLTGVPVERTLELGKSFGESANAIALFDGNVTAQPGGLYAAMAIHSLNLLKGNINRPGGIYLQPKVPLNPLATGAAAGRPAPSSRLSIEDLAELAPENVPDIAFLYYSNPVYSSTSPQRIEQLLSKTRLVVSFSPFLDETSHFADYILPDCLPLERWDDRLFPPESPVSGWGIGQPCIRAAGESRHSGDVILELAQRQGGSMAAALQWTNFEELLKHRAHGLHAARSGTLCVDPFNQGLIGEMERRGWWMSNNYSFDEFWNKLVEAGAWSDPNYQVRGISDYSGHPDGKIDLCSRNLQKRLARSKKPASEIECLPHFHSDEEPRISLEYPMTLNPYRPGKLGSGTHSILPCVLQRVGVQESVEWNSWAEVNTADARAHGIRNLDWIWVETASGKVKVRAVVYAGAGPGVVNMPYGFGHTEMGRWARGRGVNPLKLLAPERDPLSGLSYRIATRVKIYRA